jgi:hypothetical protein
MTRTSDPPSATAATRRPPTSPATSSSARDVPAAVTGLTARPGGGSGEIAVRWNSASGAQGYRVLRASSATGSFTTSADIDVTTGRATAADNVVNVWSEQYSYVPVRHTFVGPDTSPWFEYVELAPGQRCFRVVAYNAGGDGPMSPVACSLPE